METNWQAPNGRMLKVDLKQPAKQNWKEIVPTGKSPLTGFSLIGGILALDYLENVVSRVKLFDAGPCRAQIALADGRLYARDQKKLVCVDLRK